MPKFVFVITKIAQSVTYNWNQVRLSITKSIHKCSNFLFFYSLELTEILLKSEDPQELQYYWTEWHDKAGTAVRQHFNEYVALNKEAALLNSKIF